jgi:hypothetical protein
MAEGYRPAVDTADAYCFGLRADDASAARRTLDFSDPVAVILIFVMHFVPDAEGPHDIVRRLMEPLPSGSYLVMAHAASDIAAASRQRAPTLTTTAFPRRSGRGTGRGSVVSSRCISAESSAAYHRPNFQR